MLPLTYSLAWPRAARYGIAGTGLQFQMTRRLDHIDLRFGLREPRIYGQRLPGGGSGGSAAVAEAAGHRVEIYARQ